MDATSKNKSSRLQKFQMWLISIFCPYFYAQYQKLLVDRDSAQSLYIKTERCLSLYRPTTPVFISDEEIARRLFQYANRDA